MQDIRCGSCNKLLGKGKFDTVSIKCPRCKTLNTLRATSPIQERHVAPLKEVTNEQTNYSVDRRETTTG